MIFGGMGKIAGVSRGVACLCLAVCLATVGLAQKPRDGKQSSNAAPQTVSQGQPSFEQRIEDLKAYLQKHRSPLAKDAPMFVAIAAEYGLDWRLLPSIAMMETGCGRYTGKLGNNIMGWGRAQFASIEHGVRHVASRLAAGPAYRGKSLEGKLGTYNRVRKTYAEEVFEHMRGIAPVAIPVK